MERDEILSRIRGIVSQQLGVAEADVAPGASFIDDLGADSLDTVELVMRIEEEFGLELPESESEPVPTVAQLADRIAGLLAGFGCQAAPAAPAAPRPAAVSLDGIGSGPPS